jgi:uncharacterized repeat protein (TIGR01451 family)/LPXTG-motif cell wall-anchored protein
VTQGDIDAGSFTNTATVTGTDPGGSPVTDTDDDLQTFTQTPGLVLTKSGTVVDGGDGVDVGHTITYTFTVENTGNVTLTEVVAIEDVAGVVVTGGPVPSLAPGVTDTDTFTGEYTITQADIDAGTFENCATPDALVPDEEPFIGSQGCTTNDLPQDPAISVVKSGTFQDESGDGFADVGETITYAFTVENTGNVTLTDVTLADTVGGVTISGGPIATMAPGDVDNSTFTGTYAVTQADIDAGTFDNIATVSGTPPPIVDGGPVPPVTDDGDAQTPLEQNPDIMGEIGDLVWNDDNENGIQDGDEKGISGALVKLTVPDSTTLNTTTGSDGSYLFTGLPAGEYTVEIVMSSIPDPSEGELKLTTAGSFTIGLTADESYLDADFGVVAVLPVTGIDTGNIALIALALLLAGGAAVFVTTRKREDEGGLAA